MRKILCGFMALATLAICACQPTPENPIVVQKDTERMIEAAAQTAPPAEPQADEPSVLHAQYGIPETLQVQLSSADEKLLVYGNAVIHVPDADQMPIARVQADVFSQERIDCIYDALIGDTPMFLPSEITTKAKLQVLMDDLNKSLAGEKNEAMRAILEEQLKGYQEQYKNAPETNEKIKADATLNADGRVLLTADVDMDNGPVFTVSNDPEFDPDAKAMVWQDEYGNTHVDAPRSNSLLWFSSQGNDSVPPIVAYNDGVVLLDATAHSTFDEQACAECTLSTTPKEAREIVERFLVDAAIDDMTVYRVLLVAKRDWDHWETGNPLAGGMQVYEVQCRRVVNGIVVDSFNGESSAGDPNYGFNWAYEELYFSVTDKGITQMEWRAPLRVVEMINKNATLKPFQEISAIFEKMTMVIYEQRAKDMSPYRLEYEITDIKLTLQRIIEQNSYVNGLFIPVWNFYGTTTYIETDREGNELRRQMVGNQYQQPFLSINAVDGSIIDAQRGY